MKDSTLDDLKLLESSERNVILFGEKLFGKTTLLNKICGKNFPTNDSIFSYLSSSSTSCLQFAYSLKGKNIIIESPEFNPSAYIASILERKDLLSKIPVRLICIVVKYDRHIAPDQFNLIFLLFKRYSKNICVVVTHTENIPLETKSYIEKVFKKFYVKKIIFTEKNTDPWDLNEKINEEIEGKENIENIIYTREELYQILKKGNIEFIEHTNYDVIEKRYEYLNKFKEGEKKALEIINKSKNDDSKRLSYLKLEDYQNNLYYDLTKELVKIVENIKENYNDEINFQLFLFKNQALEELENFRELIEKNGFKIEPSLFDDKKNNFKQCLRCGQIWLFDGQCDEVVCGRELTQEEIEENKERAKQNKTLIKPVGCGYNLSWSKCNDFTEKLEKIIMKKYV